MRKHALEPSATVPPIQAQSQFWNDWNASTREKNLADVSEDQSRVTLRWLHGLSSQRILDVGCGSGWMSERLTPFGKVTATDLADEVLERAQRRFPEIRYVAGDFMALDFEPCDVIVSFEVLAHVENQRAFIRKLAELLVPGGILILATQNPWVLRRASWVRPTKPGQIRRWRSKRELRELLKHDFRITDMRAITPDGDQGILRIAASVKVNRLFSFLGAPRVKRLKEMLGIGRTIMIRAVRR